MNTWEGRREVGKPGDGVCSNVLVLKLSGTIPKMSMLLNLGFNPLPPQEQKKTMEYDLNDVGQLQTYYEAILSKMPESKVFFSSFFFAGGNFKSSFMVGMGEFFFYVQGNFKRPKKRATVNVRIMAKDLEGLLKDVRAKTHILLGIFVAGLFPR